MSHLLLLWRLTRQLLGRWWWGEARSPLYTTHTQSHTLFIPFLSLFLFLSFALSETHTYIHAPSHTHISPLSLVSVGANLCASLLRLHVFPTPLCAVMSKHRLRLCSVAPIAKHSSEPQDPNSKRRHHSSTYDGIT